MTRPVLRKATLADVPQLEALIARSARGLSAEDYRPSQIEGALRGRIRASIRSCWLIKPIL